MRKSEISNEALTVLTNSRIESFEKGSLLFLPEEQLDRKLYEEVNKVLENLGGKWNRKNKAHLFPSDPTDAISDACLTGSYTRLDKNGFFPTPKALADEMVQMVAERATDYLEPSCGDGNIVESILTLRSECRLLDLVEPNKKLLDKAMDTAAACGTPYLAYNDYNVTFEEFLAANEDVPPQYDAIVMNPPFERGQDAAHIRAAIDLLNPQGELVAICSAGLLFRQDRKYKELREFLVNNGGTVTQLPEGTFKESGTMVNTVLIYYKNNEAETIEKKSLRTKRKL